MSLLLPDDLHNRAVVATTGPLGYALADMDTCDQGGGDLENASSECCAARRARRRRRSRSGRTHPGLRVSGRRFLARPVYCTVLVNLFPLLHRLGVPPARLAHAYADPR